MSNKTTSCLCFFFQAEDGIRDTSVTEFRRVLFRSLTFTDELLVLLEPPWLVDELDELWALTVEIGRASCRESVQVWVAGAGEEETEQRVDAAGEHVEKHGIRCRRVRRRRWNAR